MVKEWIPSDRKKKERIKRWKVRLLNVEKEYICEQEIHSLKPCQTVFQVQGQICTSKRQCRTPNGHKKECNGSIAEMEVMMLRETSRAWKENISWFLSHVEFSKCKREALRVGEGKAGDTEMVRERVHEIKVCWEHSENGAVKSITLYNLCW